MYQKAKYFTNYYASLLAGYEAQDKYPPTDCRANMNDMLAEWDYYTDALNSMAYTSTINAMPHLVPFHRYISDHVWASKTSNGTIYGVNGRVFCTVRALIQYCATIQSARCQSAQSRARLSGLNNGMASNRMLQSFAKAERKIEEALA